MAVETITPPQKWVTECIVNVITTLIVSYILKQELVTIKTGKAKYTTKYLKLWSILCITCGPITGISWILLTFDGVCLVTWYTKSLFGVWQSVFMGIYQVSRLYYCFSENQIHSAKGYPNWVFILMFGLGIYFFINDIFHPAIEGFTVNCGLNDKYQYVEIKSDWHWMPEWYLIYSDSILWVLYLGWDIGTLILYVAKIKYFERLQRDSNHNNSVINQRVLNIMYRVVILTLFYEFLVIIAAVVWNNGFHINFTIIYSISMYLMMEHNDKEYGKFIKFIHRFKLHYLCCCYRHIIVDQVKDMFIKDLELQKDETTNDVTSAHDHDRVTNNDNQDIENKTAKHQQYNTKTYETHDISIGHGKIPECIEEEKTRSSSRNM